MKKVGSKWSLIPVFWVIIFLLLVLSFVILSYANFFRVQTNVESARYLLSALVQSQAAILAIVISLTIIAIQFHASAYSPRVIKIFRESLGWLALFVSYGISIFYGLLVLKMIKSVDELHPTILSSITYLDMPLEFHISLAYALGCLAFLILIMYLISIISLFNPATIINRLAKYITKDRLLNEKEDPIQPVMDIVHGSIMKYDLATTRVGLKAVTDRVIEIIDSEGEKEISERFCNHLERVGRLAISREDEDSTAGVIKNLENFGISVTKKDLKDETEQTIEFLGDVGVIAAKRELEYVTSQAAISLGKVGVAAANNNDDEDLALHAANILQSVGVAASKKGLEDTTWQAERSLRDVGMAAVENEFENAAEQAAKSLGFVGVAAAENGLVDGTTHAAMFLENIGKKSVEKKLDSGVRQVAIALKYVGENAAMLDREKVIEKGVTSLGKVGEDAAKTGRELDGASREVVQCLGSVGLLAAKDKFEVSTYQAALSLIAIGRTAITNEIEPVAQRAAGFLAELVIESRKATATAIRIQEAEYINDESFKKFSDLYLEELKIRRVKKKRSD